MKAFLLTFGFVLFLAINLFSQEKVVEVYGEKYVNRLLKESPRTLEYLSFFADNSYYIIDYPEGKDFPDISTCTKKSIHVPAEKIPDFNVENVDQNNILFYNIKREFNNRTFYKLGNTGKAIVFYSEKELTSKFNELKQPK